MGLLARLFRVGTNPQSAAFRRRRAAELHGQVIRYVTEQRNDNEDVIGRGGALAVSGDEFIVDSSGDTLFRCKVDLLEAVVVAHHQVLQQLRLQVITKLFKYLMKML